MNFRPGQTSSTAQTFTSTSSAARPISRTAFSSSEVARPEAFFGQQIQSIPASSIAAASFGSAFASADRSTSNTCR